MDTWIEIGDVNESIVTVIIGKKKFSSAILCACASLKFVFSFVLF